MVKMDFNPRSPVESDFTVSRRPQPDEYFNPRSPVESDPQKYGPMTHDNRFQSTLSRRERRRIRLIPSPVSDFNPRSPVESDKSYLEGEEAEPISIHALP